MSLDRPPTLKELEAAKSSLERQIVQLKKMIARRKAAPDPNQIPMF